jgi:two-component system, NtrC family, C4-dicarboxylate transport response regulator DctD
MKPETHENATVAVIDDDEAARLSIGQMLRLRRYSVELFSSAEAALAWPGLAGAEAVVSDVKMPGMDGEEFLEETARRGLPCPIVMITGHGDIAMAVRCLKAGAYDFLEKPFEDDLLLACVGRAVENTALRREGHELRRRLDMMEPGEDGRFGMIGTSRVMQDVYQQIVVAARTDVPVLIAGETGVGKELVARAIHAESNRAKGPFVPVNAGALPETMLESELFGHARGAFTGADTDRDGKLVAASGGTLLLDEVESISQRAQVQLLRVLEDGVLNPLGKDESRQVDVRILATTKTDLAELVRSGQMREDFYHRIVVLTIGVPPLRDRAEDIAPLISYFMKRTADRCGLAMPRVPEDILSDMTNHGWAGNVRELRNAVECMVSTATDGVVGRFDRQDAFGAGRLLSLPPAGGRLRREMERVEHSVIAEALRESQGEVTAASAALGISRRALYERMKKYGLSREEFLPS